MTPVQLIERARRAAASSALLFDAGDIQGACNRAYYAMFDAARAALLSAHEELPAETAKTHSGLISLFSLKLVKPGLISPEQGRALRQVDQIRLIADYSDEEVDRETGARAIDQANGFIAAIALYLDSVRS